MSRDEKRLNGKKSADIIHNKINIHGNLKLNVRENSSTKLKIRDPNEAMHSVRRPRGSVYLSDNLHYVSSKQSEDPSKKSSQDGIRVQYKSVNHSHRRASPKISPSVSHKKDNYYSVLRNEAEYIKMMFSDLKGIMNKCRIDNEYNIPDTVPCKKLTLAITLLKFNLQL